MLCLLKDYIYYVYIYVIPRWRNLSSSTTIWPSLFHSFSLTYSFEILSSWLIPLELSAVTVHSVRVSRDAPMYTVLSVLVSDFVRGSVPILNSIYIWTVRLSLLNMIYITWFDTLESKLFRGLQRVFWPVNTHVKQDESNFWSRCRGSSVHVYSLALILCRAHSHSIQSFELFPFLVVLQNFDEEHSLIIGCHASVN